MSRESRWRIDELESVRTQLSATHSIPLVTARILDQGFPVGGLVGFDHERMRIDHLNDANLEGPLGEMMRLDTEMPYDAWVTVVVYLMDDRED